MGARESNQGFIDLHTPFGMFLLVLGFLLVISFIAAGAAFFKAGLERDREIRKELKRQSRPPAP